MPDRSVRELARVRRLGISARLVDPAAPATILRVDITGREPEFVRVGEPLSGLAAELRVPLRIALATRHRRLGNGTTSVTHDRIEATSTADPIAVLSEGRIDRVGPTLGLSRRPANLSVAAILGSPEMNVLPFRPAEGGTVLAAGDVPPWADATLGAGERTFGSAPSIRPSPRPRSERARPVACVSSNIRAPRCFSVSRPGPARRTSPCCRSTR